MSNSPWEQKRKHLNDHSKLLLNARLCAREVWDDNAIGEHTEWLADRILEIWPGPDELRMSA